MSQKPLAIDLYCGLGGWTEGLLAEGWYVVGFDIERHIYGDEKYPGQLVIQDVRTLHGSQFKSASLIVASPPCQEFSYMAMPWSRAKAKRAALLNDAEGRKRLNELFDACFRIQREACEAARHHIPMVVENVRGANEWVGRSRWNFGSFHLWGDVPALMPIGMVRKTKGHPNVRNGHCHTRHLTNPIEHCTCPTICDCQDEPRGLCSNECPVHNVYPDPSQTCPIHGEPQGGRKGVGAGAEWFDGNLCRFGSASPARARARAQVSKIPLPLSTHIARVFKP